MASPTITFNSGTGSDTTSSGSGGTAISGSSASTSGASTTVSLLTDNPDLSGVATDGSAVIRITGRGFYAITAKDNTAGVKTVTVGTAINQSTPAAWAIGGKLATLDATESRRIFAATAAGVGADSGTGGATGGWTLTLEDDQVLTGTTITLAATAGTGYITINSSAAGTRRKITQGTSSATHFTLNTSNKWKLVDLAFENTHGTPLEVFTASSTTNVEMRNCLAGNSSGTNCPKGLYTRTGGGANFAMYDCAVTRCTAYVTNSTLGTFWALGCDFSYNGGAAFNTIGLPHFALINCIVSHNSGEGITSTTTGNATLFLIWGCTFHANTKEAIKISGNACTGSVQIINNQITANGATGSLYGINFSGTAPHAPIVEYNNFGNASDSTNNAGGTATGITLSATNTTVAPAYTNSANSVRNFAVGTAMKATGFTPTTTTIGAGQSGSTTYVDIGAVQRQEAAAGGGAMVIGG